MKLELTKENFNEYYKIFHTPKRFLNPEQRKIKNWMRYELKKDIQLDREDSEGERMIQNTLDNY